MTTEWKRDTEWGNWADIAVKFKAVGTAALSGPVV
jgi:hypothetical protein